MILSSTVKCSSYSFMKVVKSPFVMVLFLSVMSSHEILSELSSPLSALLAVRELASIKYISVKVRFMQYNNIIVHAQYYIAIISSDIYITWQSLHKNVGQVITQKPTKRAAFFSPVTQKMS